MKTIKILWLAVPVIFLLALVTALVGPQRELKPEVRGRLIAVEADPSDPASVDRARKKIEEAYEHLEKGADFIKVAGMTSEALSVDDNADMGWIGKGVLPKSLEDTLFSLEPGHYSEIIQGHAGEKIVFRILYAEERRNF